MGQAQSAHGAARSHEDLVRELASRFADKCFTPLELYSFKDVFKSLADHEGDIRYLKEATVARFLQLPDVLGASPVVFQMLSYMGAFPFLGEAPVVLGIEQMVMVIVILTERYERVLAKGATDRRKLLFKSLAVYDRKAASERPRSKKGGQEGGEAVDEGSEAAATTTAPIPTGSSRTNVPTLGFSIDVPVDDPDDDGDGAGGDSDADDELVLAAFETLDVISSFKHGDAPTTHGALIPGDNFRKLVVLLLLAAPLDAQEPLASRAASLADEDELDGLRATAEHVLAAFLDVETAPGIRFARFNRVVPAALPFLFDALAPLFEHFLFSQGLDFTKHKNGSRPAPPLPTPTVSMPTSPAYHKKGPTVTTTAASADAALEKPPLLQDKAEILTLPVLSQLSFFIPGRDLFRRLRLLYAGAEAGFSLGSFQSKVFNWRAPTILLVRGSRVSPPAADSSSSYYSHSHSHSSSGPEAALAAALPPKRLPDGCKGDRLTFGAFLSTPWRNTTASATAFGESDSLLFQLEPVHDVFRASELNRDYASFSRPPAPKPGGVAFGCQVPRASSVTGAVRRRSGLGGPSAADDAVPGSTLFPASPGPVSLLLDGSFEFGVFNHDVGRRSSSSGGAGGGGGGAFHPSSFRRFSFQDRFAVEAVEVWGCGGDAEAQAQAERWAWERREADARRRINLGTGDIDADRALLEMAGLIGGAGSRSGGSIL